MEIIKLTSLLKPQTRNDIYQIQNDKYWKESSLTFYGRPSLLKRNHLLGMSYTLIHWFICSRRRRDDWKNSLELCQVDAIGYSSNFVVCFLYLFCCNVPVLSVLALSALLVFVPVMILEAILIINYFLTGQFLTLVPLGHWLHPTMKKISWTNSTAMPHLIYNHRNQPSMRSSRSNPLGEFGCSGKWWDSPAYGSQLWIGQCYHRKS